MRKNVICGLICIAIIVASAGFAGAEQKKKPQNIKQAPAAAEKAPVEKDEEPVKEDVSEITIKKVVYQKNVEEKAVPKDLIDMDPFHVFNTDYPIEMAAFSPDGKYLAMIGAKKAIHSAKIRTKYRSLINVWEVGSGKEVVNKEIEVGGNEDLRNLVFSPDGGYLAIGSNYRRVIIFKVDGMEKLEEKDFCPANVDCSWGGGVSSIAFSPDGQYLATANNEGEYPSSKLRVFEVGSWKELTSINYEKGIRSVAFSPDSQILATGGKDNSIHMLNRGSWNEVFNIKDSAFNEGFYSVAFSQDNTLLVGCQRYSSPNNERGDMFVYEVGSWNKLQKFENTRRAVFSSDSRLLIVEDGQWKTNLRIFEVGNWNNLYSIYNMRIIATNGKWAIVTDANNNKQLLLDMSPIAAYYLRNDLEKLIFMPKSAELKSRLEQIETDFQDKAKVIESEKNDALAKLGSTKKDEFETEAAFKSRMDQRDADIKNINNLFKESLLPIRRERAANRIKLYEELGTILDATRKPIKFDISLKTYNADAQLFPLSIMENGVEFYSAFVKVPKDKAKGFKENIANYQVSGETQLDRTGRIKIVNAAIKDAEGAIYQISNPHLSGDVIFTGTY